ncbi:hypothetical protein B296_00026283 [Ensete ventricosum]|uniref:Uncharacterized protein n=1 Tax=Ensete ventricosum TaxID=4639 RepID=A0A426ZR91_ENSVE|nr:hypothetical protein B296_00026283 [Ensete ventricosum]
MLITTACLSSTAVGSFPHEVGSNRMAVSVCLKGGREHSRPDAWAPSRPPASRLARHTRNVVTSVSLSQAYILVTRVTL